MHCPPLHCPDALKAQLSPAHSPHIPRVQAVPPQKTLSPKKNITSVPACPSFPVFPLPTGHSSLSPPICGAGGPQSLKGGHTAPTPGPGPAQGAIWSGNMSRFSIILSSLSPQGTDTSWCHRCPCPPQVLSSIFWWLLQTQPVLLESAATPGQCPQPCITLSPVWPLYGCQWPSCPPQILIPRCHPAPPAPRGSQAGQDTSPLSPGSHHHLLQQCCVQPRRALEAPFPGQAVHLPPSLGFLLCSGDFLSLSLPPAAHGVLK